MSFKGTIVALTVAAVVGFTASQAHADFSGPYVGVQLGYGKTTADVSGTVGGTSFSGDDSEGGVNYGILGGYGRQFGNFYLGGELEASLSNAEYSQTVNGVSGRIEQDWTLGAALRAGYVVAPNTMIYGRAGIVSTNFEGSATNGASSVSADENFTGFRFGGGVEFLVTQNIGLRAEYTRTEYADKTFTSGANTVNIDGHEDLFRIAVSFKF